MGVQIHGERGAGGQIADEKRGRQRRGVRHPQARVPVNGIQDEERRLTAVEAGQALHAQGVGGLVDDGAILRRMRFSCGKNRILMLDNCATVLTAHNFAKKRRDYVPIENGTYATNE